MDKNVHIRRNSKVMRDFYLSAVKSPAESKRPRDYYRLVRASPPEEAARPESEDACPLGK